MNERIITTKKTITVRCENPFKNSNSRSRIYEFVKLLGANIGTGIDCPLEISHTLGDNEDQEVVEMQMRAWLGNTIELAESLEAKVNPF